MKNRQDPNQHNDEDVPLQQSFVAKPPAGALRTFANTGEPPFGHVSGFVPKVMAPMPTLTNGVQPAYHLKITATPINKPANGEPLDYVVMAGPNEVGVTQREYLDMEGTTVAHCKPNLDALQENSRISIRPVNAEPLLDGLPDPGLGQGGVGSYDPSIGAQVHAYPGTEGLDPRHIFNRLLLPAGTGDVLKRPQPKINLQKMKEQRIKQGHRTIPRLRVSQDEFDKLEQSSLKKQERSGKGWWPWGKHNKREEAKERDTQEVYAEQMRNKLKLDLGDKRDSIESIPNAPSNAIPLDRGYSRMMPSLLSPTDDNKPNYYNWIVPADGVSTMAGADLVDRGTEGSQAEERASGKRSSIRNSIMGGIEKLVGRRSEPDAQHQLPPLHFQGSAELANFLEHPSTGLLWEDGDEDDSTSGNSEDASQRIRPAIVYGGVEHAPPVYAGRLSPIRYFVHAMETHQYIPMSGSEHPYFMQNNLNPHTEALFGPVPLPFDPINTGMPAPTFATTDAFGRPMVQTSPLLRTYFDPELPVEYGEVLDNFQNREQQKLSQPQTP